MIGEGPAARSVRIELPAVHPGGRDHTVGSHDAALAERFGIPLRMCSTRRPNSKRSCSALPVPEHAARCRWQREIAKRSRGTPRVANRLLRRVRDFAAVAGDAGSMPDRRCGADETEVDGRGLDAMDRRYLACIAENYGGGPVGAETLAAALANSAT